ncbi:MAG: RagB/SusD family nutrient uptake outer membrane protein [Bacteroidota bacterium]
MRYLISLSILLLASLTLTSCNDDEDFLTRPPLDEMSDETYWTSEENVRSFAWDFYPEYFGAYGSGFTWGRYFAGQTLNDDFAPSEPAEFVENVPTSGGGWSFDWVRKANLMIDRVEGMDMEEEAVDHWVGIARFFRALEYNDLSKAFGGVPWYDEVLEEDDDEQLYKDRDDLTTVVDNMLADFEYAVDNVRAEDGTPGLTVNRDVVLAFMSRVFLYHGTYFKYHDIDQDKADTYLQAAKDAAEELIDSGAYSLGDDYRSLFNSMDLSGNPEMIMYRKYEEGTLTHSLNTYSNKESQSGASKNAIDSYRMDNGLPIRQGGSGYQGDEGIDNVMADRDPRITETFVQELRINGEVSNYSTSGYAQHKFLNEDIADENIGVSSQNPTDGPVIRYGEVLLNFAEASYELDDKISQADLDKSINVLRSRNGVDMPDLEVNGNQAMVNGQTIDDPRQDEYDSEISDILWEIRRERRVELMMEGFRLDDLKRWEKLEKTDTEDNEDINLGAWIDLNDHPEADVDIEGGGDEGFILPAAESASQRRFEDDKVYLSPIPLDQIQLYEDNGASLEQNPGW